jgi:hypothetical protein
MGDRGRQHDERFERDLFYIGLLFHERKYMDGGNDNGPFRNLWQRLRGL